MKNKKIISMIILSAVLVPFVSCFNDDEGSNSLHVRYVAVSSHTGLDTTARYSTTGFSWPGSYKVLVSQTETINGITYGDDFYVGVGNGGYSFQSADGMNWTPTNLGAAVNYNDIAVGEKHNESPWRPYFVAVGENGAVMYSSTHGKSWNTGASGITLDLNAVAFGNTTTGLSMFVAVGDASTFEPKESPKNGTIIYSITAGETWIDHSSGGTTLDLYCVTFGGGRFIAAGQYGVMLYSTNGSVWQFTNGSASENIYGLAYGAADNTLVWVAVGVYGTLLYSHDNGNTWSAASFDTGTLWESVIYNNERFYAVGHTNNTGRIIYSDDGINWIEAAAFTNADYYLQDIACENDAF